MNRLAATCAVSLCAAFMIGGSPEARAEGCAITDGRGEARASASAPWAPLVKGMATPQSGEIRAATEALRLCLAKDTSVELRPGTTIVLRGETRISVDAATQVSAIDMVLREGEVAVDASPSMWRGPLRKPVAVRGPGDVLAVDWGGGTRARYLPARGALPAGLLAGSYRGDVMVSGQTTMRPVHAGHVVELRKGVSSTPRLLPASPAWSADLGPRSPGSVGLVASDDGAAIVAARFDPTDGAIGYDAEIASDEGFKAVIARMSMSAGDTVVASPPLHAGRYFARVSARTIDGLPSLPSVPKPLRVARISLPTGGALLDGLVVLPPNRPFKWEDAEGLEVGKTGSGFVKAGVGLGLGVGESQIVARLRLVGESTYVPIVLTPQSFHAEIDLGPKTATWPLDPVWITVKVTSPSEAAPAFEPTLRVTVNLREEPVVFRRERDVLRAMVPPRAGRGPWAVRVEARDQGGKEIGFGMLEIIGREVARRDP